MKTTSIIKTITKGVGYAGMAGVVVIAPNATIAFDQLAKMYNKKSKKSYPDYLKRSGYFEATNKDGAYVIRLSSKGKSQFNNLGLEEYEFETKQMDDWDGKWHLLMFDIPETHRRVRQAILYKLKGLGMRQVQDSVYVHYLSTEELADILRVTYPHVATLIVSATVSRIDGENQLRKAFEI